MASDGLWDLMSFSKAAKSVRHKLPEAAVSALIQVCVNKKGGGGSALSGWWWRVWGGGGSNPVRHKLPEAAVSALIDVC